MKSVVADWQTRAICLRIVPVDSSAPTIRLTHYVHGLTMAGGAVYGVFKGYEFTGYEAGTDMSPRAIDVSGIFDASGISREQIVSGVYDNARCFLFATSFLAPVEDEEEIIASISGKVTMIDDKFVIEEMALIEALNQSIGETYNVRCSREFGATTGRIFKRCGLDLGPLTKTGTLTAVTSRFICRDSARSEVADWFAYGTLQFNSGANAGMKPTQIKRYELDGTIEVFDALPYAMAVGDSYTIIPGCRKRLEDCRDKYNNVLNGMFFTRIPTNNQATKWGDK